MMITMYITIYILFFPE